MKYVKEDMPHGFITNHEFCEFLPRAKPGQDITQKADRLGPRCMVVMNGKTMFGHITGLVAGGIEFMPHGVFRHEAFDSIETPVPKENQP
jgi:hypothetical protein